MKSTKKLLVTGSSGLIGSALVEHFAEQEGWVVYGIDANARAIFFGPQGDTLWNKERLLQKYTNFYHYDFDIRNQSSVDNLVKEIRPCAIVHAAAQPSHDLAAEIPFDDFHTNATGTLNLLEACRQYCRESPFIFMSTNKVYGDAPNELPLIELETRWDYAREEDKGGISEKMRVDQSLHTLFGASKLSADILVQEYGRYFNMLTCCLRGGCLTGPMHSGVALHGFLSYLVKCAFVGQVYKIYGYKAKQVRDNLHSRDVALFIEEFIQNPRSATVYNIGGGRLNSCSIIEAVNLVEQLGKRKLKWDYIEQNRKGDHICYISDLGLLKSDYPNWDLTISLEMIILEIAEAWNSRLNELV